MQTSLMIPAVLIQMQYFDAEIQVLNKKKRLSEAFLKKIRLKKSFLK